MEMDMEVDDDKLMEEDREVEGMNREINRMRRWRRTDRWKGIGRRRVQADAQEHEGDVGPSDGEGREGCGGQGAGQEHGGGVGLINRGGQGGGKGQRVG